MDGIRLGHKPQENGLLMWEGAYLTRTKLITLSTCEYSRDNGRMVVVAKKTASAPEVGGNA